MFSELKNLANRSIILGLLNQMAEIEPFSEHPELVEIIRKEIQE